jgi:hypothetical protein
MDRVASGGDDIADEAAVNEFGEQGVVDRLITLILYYTTLAMILNVAQTEALGPWATA